MEKEKQILVEYNTFFSLVFSLKKTGDIEIDPGDVTNILLYEI